MTKTQNKTLYTELCLLRIVERGAFEHSLKAEAKSIQTCEILKRLFASALATFSGIAVSGDMVSTTVFGWFVMLRSDG